MLASGGRNYVISRYLLYMNNKLRINIKRENAYEIKVATNRGWME